MCDYNAMEQNHEWNTNKRREYKKDLDTETIRIATGHLPNWECQVGVSIPCTSSTNWLVCIVLV